MFPYLYSSTLNMSSAVLYVDKLRSLHILSSTLSRIFFTSTEPFGSPCFCRLSQSLLHRWKFLLYPLNLGKQVGFILSVGCGAGTGICGTLPLSLSSSAIICAVRNPVLLASRLFLNAFRSFTLASSHSFSATGIHISHSARLVIASWTCAFAPSHCSSKPSLFTALTGI